MPFRDDGWFRFSLWVPQNLKFKILSCGHFYQYLKQYNESTVENWYAGRFEFSKDDEGFGS